MFGNMFNGNEDDVDLKTAIEESKRLQAELEAGTHVPERPRPQCKLAGINNQGATCYLNSLLQTLFFTPEFREALFQLSENELGRLEDRDKPGLKVRVIPLQLKRLFLRLLISDQQSISTIELTESFGWTNREELQQHDVQELNRILFLAIEESLAGTNGTDLIKRLYHGKLVNQIICLQCRNISEREEEFLDLAVTVSGVDSLEASLRPMFCDMEVMEGKNQYRCGNCHKLVNAKKGARIRSLPAILTISLLRFSYNFQKMERYKETGKFTFPTTLNMKEFLEEDLSVEDTEYELFSVVIHRGGAYGGHYHAYIRDVDNLGNWVNPDSPSLEIPSPAPGVNDVIDYVNAVDLCHKILSRHPNRALTTNQLCVEICKHSGGSWNKCFKKRHGTINKFLHKHDDKFVLNYDTSYVTLTEDMPQKDKKKIQHSKSDTLDKSDDNSPTDNRDRRKEWRPCSPLPPEGSRWYNFDDSVVTPIRVKDIETQFSGKESAYMLFYRKKSLVRPKEAMGNPIYKISDNLIAPIIEENSELEQKRQEYEFAVNTITIQIHFGCNYQYLDGALKTSEADCSFTELTIDRRETVRELILAVKEVGGELVPKRLVLHRMRDLPAGFHLYDEITEDVSKELMKLSIDNETKLFAWDGCKVQDKSIPVGALCEPVYLTIIHGNPEQFSCGFSKNMTFDDFRSCVCDLTKVSFSTVVLKRIVGRDSAMHVQILEDTTATLDGLQFKDGDQIIVEDKEKDSSLAEKTAAQQSQFFVTVQNKCGQNLHDGTWPKMRININKDMLLSEVKSRSLEMFGIQEILDGGRLRVDHDSLGMRPPLNEELTVGDAGITKSSVLVLEPGKAPEKNQITLTVSSGDVLHLFPDMEVTIERHVTVDSCLTDIINKCGVKGDSWHLRKTNWCGEAADLIDDLSLSLEDSLINDGDCILLEEGKLPPKGFFRLPVLLDSSQDNSAHSGIISSIASSIQSLLSKMISTSTTAPLNNLVQIGEVEISKDASLEELKLQLLTLPHVQQLTIPTPDFMRVRLVENNHLTSVLKVLHHSIRRQKVTSGSRIAIQVLSYEEKLSQYETVLTIVQRIADTREYGAEKELIWNTSRSADALSLRQSIADMLLIQVESIAIAKHFPQKFMWLPIIEPPPPKQDGHKSRKKGRAPKPVSLKQAPYHISDGDVIGIKGADAVEDDFATAEDDVGQEEIKREAEEKRKMREDRKNASEIDKPRKRKPEVQLTIKVDNFT